jgi:hypothetical protein
LGELKAMHHAGQEPSATLHSALCIVIPPIHPYQMVIAKHTSHLMRISIPKEQNKKGNIMEISRKNRPATPTLTLTS